MSLFITSPSQATRHSVYAIEQPPPATIASTNTGVSVIVGQFPWGPSETLTYPGSMGQFFQTFAPAGMSRTGSAHLSVIRKAWPTLGAVRVEGSSATKATAVIQTSGSVTVLTLTAGSFGTAGNSLIATVGPADDGNANHFNLTVSVSGASGTTVEIYRNLNVSSSGAQVLPTLTNSVLLSLAVAGTQGVPAAGNTTFSGGTDGTINSQLYVGTPGGGDAGFALLESDNTINFVFTDDPGNSLRAAVNAGLLAHVELTTDRMGIINGNSGQTAANAQTDVANYRSTRVIYTDPWTNIYDDTDGTMRLVPSSSWAASVASQLPPSVSIAWKADFVSAMMQGIVGLEFDRGGNAGLNTNAGITTLIYRATGGIAFEAGKNTSLTAGQTNIARTRMLQYIARSTVQSWQPYVDAPNVPFFQQDLVNSLYVFLADLKTNKSTNPAFLPCINDFAIQPTAASNTNASIQAGNFTVATQIQTISSMERIFLNMQAGETVTIQAA